MVNRDTEKPGGESDAGCACCQHSVEVRGMEHIVCLAYLSVRPSIAADVCVEFEIKRNRSVAPPLG